MFVFVWMRRRADTYLKMILINYNSPENIGFTFNGYIVLYL